MTKYRLLALSIAGLSVLSLFTSALLPPKASAVTGADWKAGRIIDDLIFTDKGSMSVSQIQDFLNQKVGTGGYASVPGQCDTNGAKSAQPFSSATRAEYARSLGRPDKFTCLNMYYEVPKTTPGPDIPASNYGGAPIPAGAKSAAQLIWDAAQAYNISPKVLLVTIQKESSGPLTTDDWPFQKQYTYAMGAHCPDSGPNGSANCDSNYSGFSLQIRESASLFRWYLDNMNQSWWTYKKPFQNNFIKWDVPDSCGGSNVYIESRATAALYTYTPYQPNATALSNVYGSQDDGCSAYGNRNFWRIYNDWFGSTLVPNYSATPVNQSYYPVVKQGESAPAYFTYRNTGSAPWYDEMSAWPANQKPVRLGTDDGLNRNSPFGNKWRFGPSRAAEIFSEVIEADGTTLAANQHIVMPGQYGRFRFNFVTPTNLSPGFYHEAFRPIVEGLGPMNGSGGWLGVTVESANYQAKPMGQSYYPTMLQGQSASGYLRYQNVGNIAWFDEYTAWDNNRPPVRLGTDNALNRNSPFGSTWRYGPTRAAEIFNVVYEADNKTLAANQHVVYPGQIGEFRFIFKAPSNIAPGTYAEAFRPIVEGVGAMNPTGTWLGVNIAAAQYSAKPVGQSPWPYVNRGASATGYFMFQNTGNIAWFDEYTAWGNGQPPVRLGTDNPLNRSSIFGSAWRFGPSRAAEIFSAVYEANGSTLAANQHIVYPGQVAKFNIDFKAVPTMSTGTYAEAFRPIVEGVGAMNPTGTWLGVVVTN